MNTPFQGKRNLPMSLRNSKKQRRTSIAPKLATVTMNNSANVRLRTRRNGRKCETNSPTLIQNNRELATALNNAKSRIRELENKRFELQSDQHELMKKYNIVTKKLQKLKGEHAEERTIDNKIFKEVCESLRLKLGEATKKLLDSTVFLDEVDKAVETLLKMSTNNVNVNQNRSVDLSKPLEITCDDSIHEAALSITKLTPPSPSITSASDNYEMSYPGDIDESRRSINRLLTTIEDYNSTTEMSDFHLVLNSTQKSSSEEMNSFKGIMDCNDNSNEVTDFEPIYSQPGSMDIDAPAPSSSKLSSWSSSPDITPIRKKRTAIRRLASTPEDCEISRFAANLSSDSPQFSPAFTLCAGRRMSRRRNTIDGFRGYKEPSINSKLRQGDPFTDCSLFQPRNTNPKKKKKTK